MDDVHKLFINRSLKRRYHVDLWNTTLKSKIVKMSNLTEPQRAPSYPNNYKNHLHHLLMKPEPASNNVILGSGKWQNTKSTDNSVTDLNSKEEEVEHIISKLNFHKSYDISKEHVSCNQRYFTHTGQSEMDHESHELLQFHSLNSPTNLSHSSNTLDKGSCPDCAAGKSGHIRHIGRWRMIDSSQ